MLTVSEAGMLGASDQEHLAFARRERRVLFTQDADFLRLHASGAEHSGIVYPRQQRTVSEMIHGLMLVFELLELGEMEDSSSSYRTRSSSSPTTSLRGDRPGRVVGKLLSESHEGRVAPCSGLSVLEV